MFATPKGDMTRSLARGTQSLDAKEAGHNGTAYEGNQDEQWCHMQDRL